MLRPGGYATLTFPDRPTIEMDTITCFHCNSVVHVKPFQDPADLGGFCKVCCHHICPKCYNSMQKGNGCTPWERQMEQVESRDRFLRSAGLQE